MKLLNLLSSLVFACVLLASCYHEDDFSVQIEAASDGGEQNELTLKQKLINIQNSGKDVITRSLYASKSQLQLKEYKNMGTITSDRELDQLKSELLSDKGYFPYYDIAKENIVLLTWPEIEGDKQNIEIRYSKSDLREFLNKRIKVGMNKMELTWECNSKIYKTNCITSDEEIVYDNIITNILCISEDSQFAKGVSPMIKTRSPENVGNGEYAHEMEWTAYWLWGSERGYAKVVHSISGSTGNLKGSSCYADSYMSIGNSDAKAQIKERKRGSNGYSVCNYAYFLATPLVSGSISGGGSVDFSVSISGVGSEASGSGEDDLNSSNL